MTTYYTPASAPKQDERVQSQTQGRDTRFQARMSGRQREILEEAAAIEGRTLTDFVLTHAQEAAQRAIQEHWLLRLSERDAQTFCAALAAPWEPHAALRTAIARMQDLFDGD